MIFEHPNANSLFTPKYFSGKSEHPADLLNTGDHQMTATTVFDSTANEIEHTGMDFLSSFENHRSLSTHITQ